MPGPPFFQHIGNSHACPTPFKEPYKIFQTIQFPGSELYLIVELFRVRTSAPKAVVCTVLPDSYKMAHEVAAVGILYQKLYNRNLKKPKHTGHSGRGTRLQALI